MTDPPPADLIAALKAEQRFGFVDRLQVLLSGRVAVELQSKFKDGKAQPGVARWRTDWPWRWARD